MAEQRKQNDHRVALLNRELIEVSGVLNVNKFTEDDVILDTEMGVLNLKGEKMHMKKLNLEIGELMIEGFIKNLTYSETTDLKQKGKGILSKMFR